MSKAELEEIIRAATKMAIEGTSNRGCYDSKIVGPIAAVLIEQAIDDSGFRKALLDKIV